MEYHNNESGGELSNFAIVSGAGNRERTVCRAATDIGNRVYDCNKKDQHSKISMSIEFIPKKNVRLNIWFEELFCGFKFRMG